jgi:hypothetical protein
LTCPRQLVIRFALNRLLEKIMRGACSWLCILVLVPCVEGQSSASFTPSAGLDQGVEQPFSAPLLPPQGTVALDEVPANGLQHLIDAKVLLGFPTGVRLQAALDRETARAWVAEAFAGYALFNQVYGVGGRLLLAPASSRGGDVLLIGPGMNCYYSVGDHSGGERWFSSARDGYFVIPDVEIAWLHDFANHFGWELGLDVGLGVGVWQAFGLESGRVSPVPILSAFGGFRF